MTDNQTIKDRLVLFIRSLNIGQGKFESYVGLSNGYVNNIRKSIQPDKLQKIALQYPELNTGWLMTGEGEMLRSEQKNETISEENIYKKMYQESLQEIAVLNQEIGKLREQLAQQERLKSASDAYTSDVKNVG